MILYFERKINIEKVDLIFFMTLVSIGINLIKFNLYSSSQRGVFLSHLNQLLKNIGDLITDLRL